MTKMDWVAFKTKVNYSIFSLYANFMSISQPLIEVSPLLLDTIVR